MFFLYIVFEGVSGGTTLLFLLLRPVHQEKSLCPGGHLPNSSFFFFFFWKFRLFFRMRVFLARHGNLLTTLIY